MSLFEQFPYTNFHELNLDWLVEVVKTLKNNLVVSVNGQTGEVVLYQDPNVRFPDVDNSNWSIVRTAAGHELGIQFQNGMAYLRFDNSTERIYTTANPPPYPVTSVDGQTGAVQVFPNADTVLPAVDNTRTIMRRQIKDSNNQDIFTGIQAEADVLKRLSGTNLYPIYDQGNPPPYPVTSVNGSTGAVILAIPFADVSGQEWTASAQSPTNIWELSRYTQNGALATIRLTTANGLTEGYLEYFDEGTQTTVTKKILTTDDIPSSSGVVSLNGLTGVVTLYGNTMDLYSGSQDTVKDAIDYTRSSVAYREDGATASQNIPLGSYVIWQGEPYISTAAISSGDTLSGSNLTAKPAGIANALRSDINSISVQIGTLNSNVQSVMNASWNTYPGQSCVRHYHYESGTAASTFGVPENYVDVTVVWYTSSRAVATAIEWAAGTGRVPGKMWTNALHDSWQGWKEIAFKSDLANKADGINNVIDVSAYERTNVNAYISLWQSVANDFYGIAKVHFKSGYYATSLIRKGSGGTDGSVLSIFDANTPPVFAGLNNGSWTIYTVNMTAV